MPLSPDQIAALRAAAAREGVDPDALVAAAEEHPAESGAERKDTGAAPTATEPPKLFQYHLPFVLVRELRSKWLGLDERIADDDMLCGEFAVKHGGATAPVAPETPTP